MTLFYVPICLWHELNISKQLPAELKCCGTEDKCNLTCSLLMTVDPRSDPSPRLTCVCIHWTALYKYMPGPKKAKRTWQITRVFAAQGRYSLRDWSPFCKLCNAPGEPHKCDVIQCQLLQWMCFNYSSIRTKYHCDSKIKAGNIHITANNWSKYERGWTHWTIKRSEWVSTLVQDFLLTVGQMK